MSKYASGVGCESSVVYRGRPACELKNSLSRQQKADARQVYNEGHLMNWRHRPSRQCALCSSL